MVLVAFKREIESTGYDIAKEITYVIVLIYGHTYTNKWKHIVWTCSTSKECNAYTASHRCVYVFLGFDFEKKMQNHFAIYVGNELTLYRFALCTNRVYSLTLDTLPQLVVAPETPLPAESAGTGSLWICSFKLALLLRWQHDPQKCFTFKFHSMFRCGLGPCKLKCITQLIRYFHMKFIHCMSKVGAGLPTACMCQGHHLVQHALV